MTLSALKKKYIGDRSFYRLVFAIVVPIMIQNGITNFVSLLDNIMVGQVGNEQMSGVAIVNQLLFVYNLCIFGGLAGAGIFTAQFFGSGDTEGVRSTFRFKVWLALLLTGIAVTLFLTMDEPLIGLYLHDSAEGGDLAATLGYAQSYLQVILLGLPPFMAVQIYASTLRECGETRLPMFAGICAVLINLVFNWLLIFGNLGFPELGVVGAAWATVLSRWIEMLIVVIWTHCHTHEVTWAAGIWRTLRVPGVIVRRILVKGMPLLVNEALWSSGQTTLIQCYSQRGLSVVSALSISSTISNLFNIVFISMGSAVSIIVGQRLGAGKMEEAKDTDNKLIAFSIFASAVVGLLLALTAPLFPQIYNTSEASRSLAASLILIPGIFMPQHAFLNSCYFTLRAGGRTVITFFFDSVSAWIISVPIAFCLVRFTDLPVPWIIVFVNMGDWIKCAVGYILVRKNVWLRNFVSVQES